MSPEAYLHIIDYLGQAAKLVPRARLDIEVAITGLCGEKEQFRRNIFVTLSIVKGGQQWTTWTVNKTVSKIIRQKPNYIIFYGH